MKHRIAPFVVFVLLAAPVSNAQAQLDSGDTPPQLPDPALDMLTTAVSSDRKLVVEHNLELDAAEEKAFWPVYDKYLVKLREISESRTSLAKELAAYYDSLSTEQARGMIRDFLEFHKRRNELRTSFLPRFEKVLPAVKVVRLYQIENKIDVVIDFELSRGFPLVP